MQCHSIKMVLPKSQDRGGRYTANVFPVGVTVFGCEHLFPCRPPVSLIGNPCIPSKAVFLLHVGKNPCLQYRIEHVFKFDQNMSLE